VDADHHHNGRDPSLQFTEEARTHSLRLRARNRRDETEALIRTFRHEQKRTSNTVTRIASGDVRL